jgi:NADH-quinone oxidoreductase subunit B
VTADPMDPRRGTDQTAQGDEAWEVTGGQPSLPEEAGEKVAPAYRHPEIPQHRWLTIGPINPLTRPKTALLGPLLQGPGFVTHSAEQVIQWARARSLWQMMFGLACCAIEMMAANASLHDLDRFGVIPRGSPRQSDLLIVSGTVTYKVATMVDRVYRQMAEPRWVIAMGNCATAGSLYYHDGYSVVKGVDQIVPVDVYVSGCPPRPEALIDGILELARLIEGQPASVGREGLE